MYISNQSIICTYNMYLSSFMYYQGSGIPAGFYVAIPVPFGIDYLSSWTSLVLLVPIIHGCIAPGTKIHSDIVNPDLFLLNTSTKFGLKHFCAQMQRLLWIRPLLKKENVYSIFNLFA